MKRIFHLMYKDIIAMNGGKGSSVMMLFLLLGIFAFLTFAIPSGGLIAPCVMGAGFASMLFQNETRYHSKELNAVLPVSRRELVCSRFLLAYILYSVVCLLFYGVVYWAYSANFFNMNDADLFSKLSVNTGGMLTPAEALNLLYITAVAVGAVLLSGSLRGFFTGNSLSSAESISDMSANRKLWFRLYALVFAAFILWGLIISGFLDIGMIFGLITAVFGQLARAARGYMLSAVILAAAFMFVMYRYISTVVEYEDKEL